MCNEYVKMKGKLTGLIDNLRLLFSLKPEEMAKMRLLAIWKDPK